MIFGTESSVSLLSGVGKVRAEKLNKLGISTVGDLLRHYPRAYEYRGGVKPLAAASDGEICSFIVTIAADPTVRRVGKTNLLIKFLCYDETRNCTLVFFNNQYIVNSFSVGKKYRVYGKVKKQGRFIDIVSPVAEPYGEELLPLFPVYPATEGFPSAQIQRLIQSVLNSLPSDMLKETLPEDVIASEGLMPIYDAIRAIHRPASFDELRQAKRRLMFEEIFVFASKARRSSETGRTDGVPMSRSDAADFKKMLKFEPTSAQKRTMNEIYSDMTCRSSPYAMRRIISGDVGSGKTLCCQFAAYLAASSGYQSAIMVPTEILARQHFEDTKALLEPLGVRVELLIGEVTAKNKKRIYESLINGECDVVIGTHALITDKVEFKALGLVVCDEQHRFGVAQRNALLSKGEGTHLLVMSATPIPRTLALVLFGDMDVSVIDVMPPGRKPVKTTVLSEGERDLLHAAIRREVEACRQVYIVCSAVDEEELEEGLIPMEMMTDTFSPEEYQNRARERKAAVPYAKKLAEIFPKYNVECVHGRLKSAEKARIMSGFADGRTDILVSTTVIEVGVNVPNATLMVVEDADLFGLSQLHQLRGRVGRGSAESECVLVCARGGKDGKERLDIMASEPSGYRIAEKDLQMRGPGEFLKENSKKIRQHGDIGISLSEGLEDRALFERAVRAAEKAEKRDIL